jgi:hypothetical protein
MYYASGRFDLAINGYWGPMISWIMVPALWAGLTALVAFRIACALSAVIFLAGSLRVFDAVGLGPRDTVVASCIVILFTVYWSVTAVSPDLLVNGLLLCGLADLLTAEPTGTGAHPVRAGFLFGLSYLAKAIGLPTSLGFILILQLLRAITGASRWRTAISAVGLTVTPLAIVSLPWIVILSTHYGKPTFSTSAAISYTLVGPDADLSVPSFRDFNVPEEGRITSWEEPSKLHYQSWSPFESARAFHHQMDNIARNALYITQELSGFDVIGLGLSSAIIGFFVCPWWNRIFSQDRWRLSAPIILVDCGLYLPVYGMDTRYYVLSFPFLLISSLCLLRCFVAYCIHTDPVVNAGKRRVLESIALGLVIVLALPTTGRRAARATLAGQTEPSFLIAQRLASSLRSAPDGAVASAATSTERSYKTGTRAVTTNVGLFAAFLAGRAFYGAPSDLQNADQVLASGATIFVVPRQSPVDLALRADGRLIAIPFEPETGDREALSTIRAYRVVHR